MIFIYEDVCKGFEHAAFNAALLHIIKQAWPNHKIFFMAESSHIEYVLKYFHKEENSKVNFLAVNYSPTDLSVKKKLNHALSKVYNLFENNTLLTPVRSK